VGIAGLGTVGTGVVKLLAENAEMFDRYRNVPEEIVEVSDAKIVVVVRSEARGRVSGAEVGGRVVHLWTLRDGKVIRMELFRTRDAALAAARGG
jgi:ketosteroid isomerase-like protein